MQAAGTIIIILLLFVCQSLESSADVSRSTLEKEQTDLSCQLKKNTTIKYYFHSTVRQQYGIFGLQPYDRYVELREGQLGRVSCFGACPHASPMNVTWCVHLYNPIEEVKVCLNMNGIVNQTSLAAELQLGKCFAMKEKCGAISASSSCLWVADAPYYLDQAYLVCTSQTDGCSKTAFIDTSIDASVGNVTITELHSKPKYPVLGESAILICNASMRSSLGYIQWTHEAETFYPIYEDPFCNSRDSACYQDTSPSVGAAKSQRIRMYIVAESYAICGAVLVNMVSYLVIDHVTQGDLGKYLCIAETELTAADKNASAGLELNIVTANEINQPTSTLNVREILDSSADGGLALSETKRVSISIAVPLFVVMVAMVPAVGVGVIAVHHILNKMTYMYVDV